MQVTKEKLAAQQLVLFFLGYYKGPIDGIWSDNTIDAKRQFESEAAFVPGNPNNGLPFGERDKLPRGWRYGVRGIIGHAELTPEKTAEILEQNRARLDAATQRAAIAAAVAPVQPHPEGTAGAGVSVETSKGADDSSTPANTNDPQNVEKHDAVSGQGVAGADPAALSRQQNAPTTRASTNEIKKPGKN